MGCIGMWDMGGKGLPGSANRNFISSVIVSLLLCSLETLLKHRTLDCTGDLCCSRGGLVGCTCTVGREERMEGSLFYYVQ